MTSRSTPLASAIARLLLVTSIVPCPAGAQSVPPPEVFPTISTPDHARALGLESLRKMVAQEGGVPLPPNLADFVVDKQAAIRLGKALFWDMQVGSDGVQACASCHFMAGADSRARNAVNPGLLRVKNAREDDINGLANAPSASDLSFFRVKPDLTLTSADYPFVKTIEGVVANLDGTVTPTDGNSNDVASSMGVFYTLFQGTTKATVFDRGTRLSDPVFNSNGVSTRRVPPRNTPSPINAVFNHANFWDGRANNTFNGATPFGPQDTEAGVFVLQADRTLAKAKVALVNASLASQAVGPPLSHFEMSYGVPELGNTRTFPELGRKLLRGDAESPPLARQLVDKSDSVLGPISAYPKPGLTVSYRKLVKQAFNAKYWDYRGTLQLTRTKIAKLTAQQPTIVPSYDVLPPTGTAEPVPTKEGNFTQMEANFPLFLGLSIMLYESTLVADQTPFDRWMETGKLNERFDAEALAGLNLFVGKGHCVGCHAGPELTSASVRHVESGKKAIQPMRMAQGTALYDDGFYNIGVTPTTDDLGRGGKDMNGRPLAFSRQALARRVLGVEVPFSITGDKTIPALSEEGDVVCDDANANGLCDPSETLSASFRRAAVDGAFKAPGLRNQELMAPYMHNGGLATLRQVVEFYNRGGNFCRTNRADRDPDVEPRGMTPVELDRLVSFLLALTDQRVRLEQAPFDHPELMIPATGLSEGTTRDTLRLPPVGQGGVDAKNKPATFLGLNPRDALFTPVGVCSANTEEPVAQ